MYRTMAFMPQLRLFLGGMGMIYTVRKYKMDGAVVEVDQVGLCKRLPMGQIQSKEELEPYVKDSGFLTLDGWWDKINVFIPNGEPRYLYRVEVIEKAEKPKIKKQGVWTS